MPPPAPALAAVLVLLAAARGTAQRDLDPVELTGRDVPSLIGVRPDRIVGFAWRGGWRQIPVQTDQRAVVVFSKIRNRPNRYEHAALVYTDADTWTGADPDPLLDADDEIALMARDAGDPAGFADPRGVRRGTRVGVTVADPLGRPDRYVYLFESDGSLDPGAGADLVDYRFVLVSGDYKPTYDTRSGPNPERSDVTTARYRVAFSDRWIHDRTHVTAGSATGVDILDRHKFQFAPGNCNRTTDTFSRGGGAIIANVDGPVRAIRSVVGANSGAITQRDWICYDGRMTVRTHLRVHAIGGTWNFYDFSPAAAGMRYFDNLNAGGSGAAIDGQPDNLRTGVLLWQLATGAQGSLTMSLLLDTDIPAARLRRFSHHFDDRTPSWNQCTGDAFAYAASGPATGGLPNTDPLRGAANRLVMDRVVYFDPPGMTVARARARDAEARDPLRPRGQPRYRVFGSGCRGTAGVPMLAAAGVPEIGRTVSIACAPLASGQPGVLLLGGSDRTWNGRPLPLPLDALGMTGCRLWVTADAGVAARSTAGRAEIGLAIPNVRALTGQTVYQQYASLDPGANPAGAIGSDAGALTIGG